MTRWPEGYGRVIVDDVTSTLDEARRISAKHAGPFWLLAHQQTAARGRRGRPWAMQKGNFAATLVLPAAGPPAQAALRSFVMSLALYRTSVALTGQDMAFALKWPNDLLLNGGKVAGILLESAAPQTLSIGVGVNLVGSPPQDALEDRAVLPVSILEETAVAIAAEDFLSALAAQFAALEQQFQTYGFAPIRTGWLAHAARLGQEITARTAQSETTGTFEDVDVDGQLVLRGPRGTVRIAAADVYF